MTLNKVEWHRNCHIAQASSRLQLICISTLLLCLPLSAAISGEGPLPDHLVVDYQLGGAYPPPAGVTVVVRDSTGDPVPGLYNICYLNGFQSQPDSKWPTDLVVRKADGSALVDAEWPDEFLLDISSPSQRKANLELLLPLIAGCAKKGFKAVEFDNLDSYTRSEGLITQENAIAFATRLVNAAKENGLAAAQKNLSELGTLGRDKIGFSFVVAEECHRWDECKAYTDVYGSQVIDIEYSDDLRGTFADVCHDKNTPRATILRDRKLLPAGRVNYVYKRC